MSDTPKKRPGRPKGAEQTMALTTWVPVSTVDRLCELASKEKVSVSTMTRRILTSQLTRKR